MKTRTEIINETVAYYSEDTSRRATTKDGCCYLTEDGRMCAVGRCLNEKGKEKYNLSCVEFNPYMINFMNDEYKIYDEYFWCELQWIHDNHFNWDENGLTEKGKENVNILLESYKNQD